jgi:predicted transposase YbfD/YdcC
MAGMLKARLPELGLERVEDRRRRSGKRWALATILRSVVVGLCAGCRGFAELEGLTADMEMPVRRLLRIPRRVPDTTMRDALVRQHPWELRQVLVRMIKGALRRKALPLWGLPFHAAALDGKASSIPSWDDHYAQRQTYDDGRGAHGVVRTVSVALVSTPAKPVLDAVPIPAETNEAGIFPVVFEALVRNFGHLVRLVTYDAGVTCADNCRIVVEAGKEYLFRIKTETWHVTQEAKRLLGQASIEQAAAHTEDVTSKETSVHRYLFVRPVAAPSFWTLPGLQTLVRVRSQTEKGGQVVASEDRYYISSLAQQELTGEQWLTLVRNHWAVENNCHWTFDAIFQEDAHPWIEADPRGVVVMTLLRRIAYNLMALFRSVTQRSEDRRRMPWRRLLKWVYATLVGAEERHLRGLRERALAAEA